MSSKRHIRRKSCTGKKRYASKEEATKAVGCLKHLDHLRGVASFMSSYRCQFCGGFHVGHGKLYDPYMSKRDRFIKS